jgi:hypothetical protein
MSTLRRNLSNRASAAIGAAADWAGRGLRTAPGILGAGLICYGAGLIYRPLLFLVAGGFLLLVDRRVP